MPAENENQAIAHVLASLKEPSTDPQLELFNEGLNSLKALIQNSPDTFENATLDLNPDQFLKLVEIMGVEFLKDNVEGGFVLYVLEVLPTNATLPVLNQLGGAKYIRENVTTMLEVARLFEKLIQDLGRITGEQETKKIFEEIGIEYFASHKNKHTFKIIETLPENMRLSTIESMGGKDYIEDNIELAKSFNKIINYYFIKDPGLPILETFSSAYLNKLFEKPGSLAGLRGNFSEGLIEKVISKLDESLLNNSDPNEFFDYIKFYEPAMALKVIRQLPPEQLARIAESPDAIDLFLKIKSKSQSFQELFEPLGGLVFLKNLFQTPKRFSSNFIELSPEERVDLFNYIGASNIVNFFGADSLPILTLYQYLPKELVDQLSSTMNLSNQIKTPSDLKTILAIRSNEDVSAMLKGMDNESLKTIVKNADYYNIISVTATLKELLNISWQEFFAIYPLQDFFQENVLGQNAFSQILNSMLPAEITEVIKSLDSSYLTKNVNKELVMEAFNTEAMDVLINKIDIKTFLFSGNYPVSGLDLIAILKKMSDVNRLKVIEQFDIETLKKHVRPSYFPNLMSILPNESKWTVISDIRDIDSYLLEVLDSSDDKVLAMLDQAGNRAFYSILGSNFILERSRTTSITKLATEFNPVEVAKMILETDYQINKFEDILQNINLFSDDDKIKILLNMNNKHLQDYKNYTIDTSRDPEFMNNVPAVIRNDISFRMSGLQALSQIPQQQQIDFLISLQDNTLRRFVKNSNDLNNLITTIPKEYVETLISRLGGDTFVKVLLANSPSSMLEENLSKLYHPASQDIDDREYSHGALIKFRNDLFSGTPISGVCQGLTMMAIQAFLTGPEELIKFNKRIDFLVQHPSYYTDGTHASLMKEIVDNRDKTRNAVVANLQAEGKSIPANLSINTTLSLEQERAIDISAFMEGIELYLAPAWHKDIFNKVVMQTHEIELSKILQSQALEEKGGLVKIDTVAGIYESGRSMLDYVNLLNEHALTSNCNLSFQLSSNNHTIAICYDSNSKGWLFIDANNINSPVKNINSVDALAESVFDAFDPGGDFTGFTTSILATSEDDEAAKNFVAGLKQSTEFHLLHDVTDKNKDLTTQRSVSLAYFAMLTNDEEKLKSLIDLKAATLNQPVRYADNEDIYATPFTIGLQESSSECIRLLVDLKDDSGEFLIDLDHAPLGTVQPATLCVLVDSPDILNMLLEARDNEGKPRVNMDLISVTDKQKKISLVHYAAEFGSLSSLKVLEEHGANMTLEIDGKKPIVIAIENHQEPIVKFYTALDRRNELTQAVENLFQTGNITNFQAEQMKTVLITDFKQDHQAFLPDGKWNSNSFNIQDLGKLASTLPPLPATAYLDEIASKTESLISSDSDLDEILLIDNLESESEDDLSGKMNSTARLQVQLGLNTNKIKLNLQTDSQITPDKIPDIKAPSNTPQLESNQKGLDSQTNENNAPTKRVR